MFDQLIEFSKANPIQAAFFASLFAWGLTALGASLVFFFKKANRAVLAGEVNPVLGTPLFNLASGVSLLLFYAFAMQCMSTLAIVKRETNTWRWPIWQLLSMTTFAYIVALIAYQLLK